MSILDRTFGLIEKGREEGLPKLLFNIPKLDEHLYGIKQGHYYLIGGDTGTGKSNFVRSTFIDGVYDQVVAVNDTTKLDCLFVDFTLEIPPELNLVSTLTRKIFNDYGRVLPVNQLLSWGTASLNEDNYKIVESYKPFLKEYQKKLLIVDRETDPNMFHDVLMEVAKQTGNFLKEGRYIDECEGYKSNNPALHVIVVFDTINLAGLDSGHTTAKSSIDRISKIGVRFRNKCNFIIVPVQQFNSDLNSMDRARFGSQGPNSKDFMDSTGPTKDCTVALGLYSPLRYMRDEQTIWRNYKVDILKNWLVSIHILKNRYGQTNKYTGLKFDGAVGRFEQLPEALMMTDDDYIKATKH